MPGVWGGLDVAQGPGPHSSAGPALWAGVGRFGVAQGRWRCREGRCPRGSFTESIGAVPARARLTARLRTEVGEAAADRFSCVLAAALHYRVSWPVAQAALSGHITGPLAAPLPVVRVLGIDDTRRGKPRAVRQPRPVKELSARCLVTWLRSAWPVC